MPVWSHLLNASSSNVKKTRHKRGYSYTENKGCQEFASRHAPSRRVLTRHRPQSTTESTTLLSSSALLQTTHVKSLLRPDQPQADLYRRRVAQPTAAQHVPCPVYAVQRDQRNALLPQGFL